jgi:hypothetical protein
MVTVGFDNRTIITVNAGGLAENRAEALMPLQLCYQMWKGRPLWSLSLTDISSN